MKVVLVISRAPTRRKRVSTHGTTKDWPVESSNRRCWYMRLQDLQMKQSPYSRHFFSPMINTNHIGYSLLTIESKSMLFNIGSVVHTVQSVCIHGNFKRPHEIGWESGPSPNPKARDGLECLYSLTTGIAPDCRSMLFKYNISNVVRGYCLI